MRAKISFVRADSALKYETSKPRCRVLRQRVQPLRRHSHEPISRSWSAADLYPSNIYVLSALSPDTTKPLRATLVSGVAFGRWGRLCSIDEFPTGVRNTMKDTGQTKCYHRREGRCWVRPYQVPWNEQRKVRVLDVATSLVGVEGMAICAVSLDRRNREQLDTHTANCRPHIGGGSRNDFLTVRPGLAHVEWS
ncbi:hypothetical protein BDN72DRAFT_542005 [Pluteus cervinus]|uniref:Uncharacterized protein n=1 Tax=Pluteus cervinus TaxID=181527 RepID=A0ACD3A3G5_9AGAR|nr:hypothetical protein BDN72DRAFT_542005 [Pluteus cervinus]